MAIFDFFGTENFVEILNLEAGRGLLSMISKYVQYGLSLFLKVDN